MKVLIITGPTAVGKTEFTIRLAEYFKTEIINADSRQIYKYMDIGTAKPTIEEIRRVKHHLIDIIEPTEKYSAGNFVLDAERIIEEYFDNKLVIISGGTGFYIKSFRDGIFHGPTANEEIRNKLKKDFELYGNDYMHEKLKSIDKEAAEKIHKNDIQRIIRALEVYEITGKPLTKLHKEAENIRKKNMDIKLFTLNINREELYMRINQRVLKMLENGLIEEVESLLNKGYKKSDYGLKCIGYEETISYLEGNISKKDMIDKIQQNTRNYAKRQLIFFRGMKENEFLDLNSDYNKIFKNLVEKIKRWQDDIFKNT